jgi:hypothetical protein
LAAAAAGRWLGVGHPHAQQWITFISQYYRQIYIYTIIQYNRLLLLLEKYLVRTHPPFYFLNSPHTSPV